MSFLKSVLFGYEGSYNILGIPVTFQYKGRFTIPRDYATFLQAEYPPPNSTNPSEKTSQLSNKILNIHEFMREAGDRLTSLGYTVTFVHEMSHALADKFFNLSPEVFINTRKLTGGFGSTTVYLPPSLANWKRTIIYSAGCIGAVVFCTSIIVMAVAVEKYVSRYIVIILQSLALGQAIFQGIVYPFTSIYHHDDGDFGQIAKHCGDTHLVLATTAVVMQTALTTFVYYKTIRRLAFSV
jgi:hypothetical protein